MSQPGVWWSRWRASSMVILGLGVLVMLAALNRGAGAPKAPNAPNAAASQTGRAPSSQPQGPDAKPLLPRAPLPGSVANDPMAASQGEAELMTTLRALAFSDPLKSLALAREGQQRFPGSAAAPERHWFEARALVNLQRFDEARALAQQMVEQYPDSKWTQDVRRHLLSHPLGLPPRPR